jgi:hypothetical protein
LQKDLIIILTIKVDGYSKIYVLLKSRWQFFVIKIFCHCICKDCKHDRDRHREQFTFTDFFFVRSFIFNGPQYCCKQACAHSLYLKNLPTQRWDPFNKINYCASLFQLIILNYQWIKDVRFLPVIYVFLSLRIFVYLIEFAPEIGSIKL